MCFLLVRTLWVSCSDFFFRSDPFVLVGIGPDALAGGCDSAHLGQSGRKNLRGMGLSAGAGHSFVRVDAAGRAFAGNSRCGQRSPQDGRRYRSVFIFHLIF